jgi:hypothetical protein
VSDLSRLHRVHWGVRSRTPTSANTVFPYRFLLASSWLVILDRMSGVTRILSAIEQSDPHAAEQLLPLVYDELRKLAAARLAQEKPGQPVQATALRARCSTT